MDENGISISIFVICELSCKRPAGFIPDVIKFLEKHQLMHIVHAYLGSSKFPSKYAWNRLLKNRMHRSAISSWNSRTLTQDVYRFRVIQSEFRPHWAWYFSKSRIEI